MRIPAVLLVAASLISCTAAPKPGQAELEFPPLDPDAAETVIGEADRELLANCTEAANSILRQDQDPPLGEPLITLSEKFGTIVRFDATASEEGFDLRFRYVCWGKSSSEIAFLVAPGEIFTPDGEIKALKPLR